MNATVVNDAFGNAALVDERSVTFSASRRLTGMDKHTASRDRISLWIVLGAGLLILAFAAVSRASDYSSSTHRTDQFSSAPGIRSLAVENVSGDISVTSGAAFSATCEISVRADGASTAKKYLDETKIELRNEGDGTYSLLTEEPGVRMRRRNGRHWSLDVDRHDWHYRIETRYAITLPAGASLDAHTVNGNVSVAGVGGDVDANSVNGRVSISGTKHDVHAQSVNGSIEATVAELAHGGKLEAETVNGNIRLVLPSKAAFAFHGHTMTGDILSTFPFPVRAAAADAERLRAERDKMRAERDRMQREIREKAREREKEKREHGDSDDDDGNVDIDLSGLQEGLADLSRELAQIGPEIASQVAGSLNRSYEGTVGGGGAEVRCSTLNGRIEVVAQGNEGGLRSLLPPRRTGRGWAYAPEAPEPPEAPEAPSVPVPAPAPAPAPAPRPPRPPRPPHVNAEEGSIVRGDIDGDFSTTLPFGDVQIGRVSGAVRIVTYGGQIRINSAGKGADLSTSGGDIRIDEVRGDLRAVTHGGEVHVGSVAGNAKLETMGGDVTLGSASGSVVARTGGGDLRLHRVRGSVQASSGGGDVTCEIVGRETPEGVAISSGSGDVTLVLPSNFKASVEVQVSGVDEDTEGIVTDFPEITISRRSHSSREAGTGQLNGGGPKVTIRISSGTVHLRKGPPAQ